MDTKALNNSTIDTRVSIRDTPPLPILTDTKPQSRAHADRYEMYRIETLLIDTKCIDSNHHPLIDVKCIDTKHALRTLIHPYLVHTTSD